MDVDSGIASARLYNIKGGGWHFSLPSFCGHVGQLSRPGGNDRSMGERAEGLLPVHQLKPWAIVEKGLPIGRL